MPRSLTASQEGALWHTNILQSLITPFLWNACPWCPFVCGRWQQQRLRHRCRDHHPQFKAPSQVLLARSVLKESPPVLQNGMEEWGRRWFQPRAALHPPSSPQQRGGHPDPRRAPAAPSLQRPIWPGAGRQCDWRQPTQATPQVGPKGIRAWKLESPLWEWKIIMEMVKADMERGSDWPSRAVVITPKPDTGESISNPLCSYIYSLGGGVTPLVNGMIAYPKKRKIKEKKTHQLSLMTCC